MKRILVISVALLFVFTFFGCSNKEKQVFDSKTDIIACAQEEIEFEGTKEIAYTAERPICIYNSLSASIHEELENVDGQYDFYKDYSAYYDNNIKDKLDCSFYMVKTERKSSVFMWRNFYFYAESLFDGRYVNPSVKIYISINEEQFSKPSDDSKPDEMEPDTGLHDTIALYFTFQPITKLERSTKYSLEFGIDEREEMNRFNKYFNLYKGSTCIATCHYLLKNIKTKEPLTYEWFEEYLKENLVLQA